MSVYRRRGLPLNYNYLKDKLGGRIPFIDHIIAPADWDPISADHYQALVPDTLIAHGDRVRVFTENDQIIHVGVWERESAGDSILGNNVAVYSAIRPDNDIHFIAFAKSHVITNTTILQPQDFIFDGGENAWVYTHTLSGTPLVVEQFDDNDNPVYIDGYLKQDNHYQLKAAVAPDFNINLNIYSLP